MNIISGERESISQVKTDIDREREILLNERDKLQNVMNITALKQKEQELKDNSDEG